MTSFLLRFQVILKLPVGVLGRKGPLYRMKTHMRNTSYIMRYEYRRRHFFLQLSTRRLTLFLWVHIDNNLAYFLIHISIFSFIIIIFYCCYYCYYHYYLLLFYDRRCTHAQSSRKNGKQLTGRKV